MGGRVNGISKIRKMSCWYHHRRLLPYLEGSLPRWQRALVSRHVSACPACRQDLRVFQQITNSLREAANEAPPTALDLWQRLESRIQASAGARSRRLKPRAYPTMVSSLALAAIVAFGGYISLDHGPAHIPASTGSNSIPGRAVRIAANPAGVGAAAGLPAKDRHVFAVAPRAIARLRKRSSVLDHAAGAPAAPPRERRIHRNTRVRGHASHPGAGLRHSAAGPILANLDERVSVPVTTDPTSKSGNVTRMAMAAPTLAPSAFSAPAPTVPQNGASRAAITLRETAGNGAPEMTDAATTSGIAGSVMLAGDRVRAMDSGQNQTAAAARAIGVRGAPDAVLGHPIEERLAPEVLADSVPAAVKSYYCQVQTLNMNGDPETTSRMWGEGGPAGPVVFVQSDGASAK